MSEPINTDFKRIGELFYRRVSNASTEASFQGFIRHAFEAFDDMARLGNYEFLVLNYPSIDKNENLRLVVVPSYSNPDLNGVEMQGSVPVTDISSGIDTIMSQLEGYLTAEFSGLLLSELPRDISSRIYGQMQTQPYGKVACFNGMTIYFNKGTDLIRRAEIQRPEGPLSQAIQIISRDMAATSWMAEEKGSKPVKCGKLDQIGRELLAHANRICVNVSYHFKEDRTKDLIHERCIIVRDGSCYHWQYHTNSALDVGLPAALFPKLATLFGLIQQNFDVSAFDNFKIQTPREASYAKAR